MINSKEEYYKNLGILVIICSKFQNELVEGSKILSKKYKENETNADMKVDETKPLGFLKVQFTKIAEKFIEKFISTEEQIAKAVLKKIKKTCEENIKLRNEMFHGIWMERFWNDSNPDSFQVRYTSQKTIETSINDLSPENIENLINDIAASSNLIYDFFICLHDGLEIEDKKFSNYFKLLDNGEIEFPRESDKGSIHKYL